MRILAIFLVLLAQTSFASPKTLQCTFSYEGKDAYTLSAEIKARGALKITKIENLEFHAINPELTDDNINNNPVTPESLPDGSVKYAIDALSSEPDYGELYDLILKAPLKSGMNEASIEYTYVSRGEPTGTDVADGVCEAK